MSQELWLYKISSEPCSSNTSPVITLSIVVHKDFTWEVFVHGHKASDVLLFESIPCYIDDWNSLCQLIKVIDEAVLCALEIQMKNSYPWQKHKGKFLSPQSSIKAYVESFPVTLNDEHYSATVRTMSCTLLVREGQCKSCHAYRSQLRAMHSRWIKTANKREGFQEGEKALMCLSSETLEGLHISGKGKTCD